MQFFFKYFFNKSCLFSGLFYSYSPLFFSIIVAGNINGQIVYSIIPLVFIFFLKLLKNNNNINFIICFLLNQICLGNLSYYIQLIPIILFYFIFFTSENKKIKKILIFLFSLIIFNIWWLFVYIKLMLSNTEYSLITIDLNNNLAAHYSNLQNFILNFIGLSFLDRNFFNNILNFKIFYIGLIFFTYFKIYNIKKNSLIIFTLISLLILLFLSSEISSNLYSYIKIYLFQFKIFNIFRSPQNLLILFPFLLSILFYFTFLNYKIISKFILILFFLYPWIWEGDLGYDKLKNHPKNIGFVDLIKKDPDYVNTLKYLNEKYSYNSIIFYPYTSSPIYIKNDYQNINQGSIPEYLYLKPKIYHNEYKKGYLENIVNKNKNLKYIIIRKDIDFHHTKPTSNEKLQDYIFIKNNKLEKKIGNFEIYRSNTYTSFKQICTENKCFNINNLQIKEFFPNFYLINDFKEFVPQYLTINDSTLEVMILPKFIAKNLNLELNFFAYKPELFFCLMGWIFQIILIFFKILSGYLRMKTIYARK
jgi:hypothetical protein